MDKEKLVLEFRADMMAQLITDEEQDVMVYEAPDMPDGWDWRFFNLEDFSQMVWAAVNVVRMHYWPIRGEWEVVNNAI